MREVPLELSASWAARAARDRTLEDLLRARPMASFSSSFSSASVPIQQPLRGGAKVHLPRADLEAAISEAACAASVEAMPSSECSFIASPSGKWHRMSHAGLVSSSSSWASACGWRFVGTNATLESVVPPEPMPQVSLRPLLSGAASRT